MVTNTGWAAYDIFWKYFAVRGGFTALAFFGTIFFIA
jgi:hypothetical protein